MTTYEIKTLDGDVLAAEQETPQWDQAAMKWYAAWQAEHPGVESMLFRNGLLMATGGGVVVHSILPDDPRQVREAVAS